jgi:hypothetical protein
MCTCADRTVPRIFNWGTYIRGAFIRVGLYSGWAYIWNEVSVSTCGWAYTRGAYIQGGL